jgi:hypothetical protein
MPELEVSIDGVVTRHELLSRNKVLRIAVGESNHQSSVWRLWTGQSGDVYVAIRAVAKEWKFSLHEAGRWRYAETEDYSGLKGPTPLLDPSDRVIRRWSRQDTDRDWFHGMTIRVPFGYPNDFKYPFSFKEVRWVPEPRPGECVVLAIAMRYGSLAPVVFRSDLAPVGFRDPTYLGGIPLGDGGAVIATAFTEAMTERDEEMLREHLDQAPERMPWLTGMRPANEVVTALLFENSQAIDLWDICVGLVPPTEP